MINTDYTWGDIILSTMRKMFLNKEGIFKETLADMAEDRNYATYINQLPDIMNELMVILNNRVEADIREVQLDLEGTAIEDYVTEDISHYRFELKQYLFDNDITKRYMNLVVAQDAIIPIDNLMFEERNGIIYIPKKFMKNTDIVFKYRVRPMFYTTETSTDTIIDLPYNIVAIIPLYLASEAYKDDDIAIATQYRNQFETELNYISNTMVNFMGEEHSRNVLW